MKLYIQTSNFEIGKGGGVETFVNILKNIYIDSYIPFDNKNLVFFLWKNKPDVIHINSIWDFSLFIILIYKFLLPNSKIVISPHGMLNQINLKKSYIKKALFKIFILNFLLKKCTRFHLLTIKEKNELDQFYKKKYNYKIINNCIITKYNYIYKYFCNYEIIKYIYIGRITALKGLEDLIKAFNKLYLHNKNVRLDIYGYGENKYINYLQSITNFDCINFHNPIYDDKKDAIINQSHYLVLPTYSEGFPLISLECWHNSTVLITNENANIDFCHQYLKYDKNEHLYDILYKSSQLDIKKYNQISQNAFIYLINNHSLNNNIKLYNSIYE